MFGAKKLREPAAHSDGTPAAGLLVYAPPGYVGDEALAVALHRNGDGQAVFREATEISPREIADVRAVLALYPSPEAVTRISDEVNRVRAARDDGSPVLIVGVAPGQLTDFGGWLQRRAEAESLQGIRLVVSDDPLEIARQAADMQQPVTQTNVIAMPASTEVDTTEFKYFYCISPELRGMLAYLRELATNNIGRLYLLGGPGAGKTSLAYYFYLCRRRGNFVTVNLTSESTDDKAAMKSLLCGHVSGAFPGAGARTGAFAHARDGVCFLDESHGVSGSVMEVLMEALDSGQYLPYGASTKQPLDCGVVFASNRTWETLIASVNIDEHARLGAMIMQLADLSVRREDLIAVLAVTLDRMRRQSTTWQPVAGLTAQAWEAVKACPWRGNTRALIRVAETAYVDCATNGGTAIEVDQLRRAMELWEPAEHASHALYSSTKRDSRAEAVA